MSNRPAPDKRGADTAPRGASYLSARKAIGRGDWAEGIAAHRAAHAAGEAPSPLDELMFGIATFFRGEDASATLEWLTPALIRDADGEVPVRRYLLAPLIRADRIEKACQVLATLKDVSADPVATRRNLAGLLARLGRFDDALEQVDRNGELLPDDLAVQGDRVRFRLMAGRNAEAAAIARDLAPRSSATSEEARFVLRALIADGDLPNALEFARRFDPVRFPSPHLAADVVQTSLLAGLPFEALKAGEAALAAGIDGAALRGHLGEAILLVGSPKQVSEAGISHLEAGLALAKDDKRLNALYGEALLRSDRAKEAVLVLEKANLVEIKSPKTRLLYAKALRASGRFDDSADEYVRLLERKREDWAAHRQAVGILKQAGRVEQASSVFDAMITARSQNLPPSFEEALADLDRRVDDVRVPQARLDWAWGLRADRESMDRAEWERRAKWGMLADHLIVDWLECREEQAEEAMRVMGDLAAADEKLAPLSGKGLVIATAHLGPLFSGPILLELCSVPSRWVASTPSIGDAHYAASVISTSDQTEAQVVRDCLRSLSRGYAVGIAVDGSGRPGSPTIPFEGQHISYSDFAARAAHRAQVPSIFYAARWEGGRIGFTLEALPTPEPEEPLRPFEARWRQAYLSLLLDHLKGPPENLRLAGGLWSSIRPKDV